MLRVAYDLILATCWIGLVLSTPGLEHKVHNIVLYPDKHSWCKTTEIKQIVTFPGCSSVEIDNSVCVGACFSYTIPKTLPTPPGEIITPYCDSCQPAIYTWKDVKLNCEDQSNEDDGVTEIITKVQVISNCSCASCSKGDQVGDYSKISNDKKSHDVPELMSLMMHNRKEQVEDDDGDAEEKTEEPNLVSINEEDEDNMIVEDDKNLTVKDNLEILTVNDPDTKANVSFVEGPHHSLVLKKPPIKTQLPQTVNKKHKDDEEVPSLLANQFKIHDNIEYLDQIAVESKDNKEQVLPLPLPDLIYDKMNSSEHGIKIVEVSHDNMKPAEDGVELSYFVKDAKD